MLSREALKCCHQDTLKCYHRKAFSPLRSGSTRQHSANRSPPSTSPQSAVRSPGGLLTFHTLHGRRRATVRGSRGLRIDPAGSITLAYIGPLHSLRTRRRPRMIVSLASRISSRARCLALDLKDGGCDLRICCRGLYFVRFRRSSHDGHGSSDEPRCTHGTKPLCGYSRPPL